MTGTQQLLAIEYKFGLMKSNDRNHIKMHINAAHKRTCDMIHTVVRITTRKSFHCSGDRRAKEKEDHNGTMVCVITASKR